MDKPDDTDEDNAGSNTGKERPSFPSLKTYVPSRRRSKQLGEWSASCRLHICTHLNSGDALESKLKDTLVKHENEELENEAADQPRGKHSSRHMHTWRTPATKKQGAEGHSR